MTVPDQAIETVARRLAIEWGGDWTDHQAAAAELLMLALPEMAAAGAVAERARIRQLAEHHNVRVDMGPLSDPPSVPFADLLDPEAQPCPVHVIAPPHPGH